jgi:hypothetical protein
MYTFDMELYHGGQKKCKPTTMTGYNNPVLHKEI